MGRLSKQLITTDTGYCARKLLGFNFDRDEDTGLITNKGTGGIYDHGPHQEMVEFLDNPRKDLKRKRQMLCCRKARKTSIVVAKCVSLIVGNPNVRIFYSMITARESAKTVGQVRDSLESERVTQYFGDQKGKIWTDDHFVVAGRTDLAARNYTMWAGGLDRKVTGSRADWIFLDDLVDWTNVRNPEQIDKAITYMKLCIPLLEAGGVLVDVGTPYDEADLHHYIQDEIGSEFSFLHLDCGMDVVDDGKGGYTLDGEPRFPHLPEKQLRSDLVTMGVQDFSANMCLRVLSPQTQIFFRTQFKVAKWEAWMTRLNGYILTDTATTEADHGCFSVVAMVLVAHDDTAYLADLSVGLWSPDTFVSELLGMIKRWRPRSRLIAQLMENTAANKVYRSPIAAQSRIEQIPTNIIGLPRGVSEGSKRQRINALHPRMASDRFVVLDTVPKHVVIQGKEKPLFVADGWLDPETKERQPAGMLVDQFVRQNAKKRDIPDALADLEAVDQKGQRICQPSPAPGWSVSSAGRPPPRRQRGRSWADRAKAPNNRWSDLARRAAR